MSKTRANLLAFINDGLAHGLTVGQMADALMADKPLGDVALLVGLEAEIRDVIAEYDPADFPGMTDDAGLLEFLKRREP
jgi:hypothetical protein